MNKRFQDRVVVVTGASTGIGLAAARRFAAEGARVALFARSERDLAAAAELVGAGALVVAGDVREPADLQRLFAEVSRAWGRVDVLFANAGVAEFVSVEKADRAHYERVFDTNVRGAFFTVQAALPLLSRGASVVLTTSVANSAGVPQTSLYSASKAAVRSLARTLAGELIERGVRVNAVSPGPTESAIHAKYTATMSAAEIDRLVSALAPRMRMGRRATAEEVANAVVFLASDEASFIVGQELAVDGGLSAL